MVEPVETPPLAEALGLAPHPEGGWYRETWRSPVDVTLPDPSTGSGGPGRVRSTATLIHFLLPAGECSAWHRVSSDEIWIAHTGCVALELGGAGGVPVTEASYAVGVDVAAGQESQVLVPAGVWQRTVPGPGDALVSCLVSPGFDFSDFDLAVDG